MINNFDQLPNICKFKPGTYYTFIAFTRKKDTGLKNSLIKQWLIDSHEELNSKKQSMIDLCNNTNARLYMTTDRKSIKKTVLNIQQEVNEMIKQYLFSDNYKPSLANLNRLVTSASQKKESTDGDKYWLVDIDANNYTGRLNKDKISLLVSDTFKGLLGGLVVAELNTVNGKHLIVAKEMPLSKQFVCMLDFKLANTYQRLSPYAVSALKDRFVTFRSCYEIKENALTLIYYGGN